MKKLVLICSFVLSSLSSYASQDPLNLKTFTVAPYKCGNSRTADIVTVLGSGGQPLAGGGYDFNLSDPTFNQSIVATTNTDWSAFNASLAATGPHSLMQWKLTDAASTFIQGTITLANLNSINDQAQASITLTAPSLSGTGSISIEVDGITGPLTIEFVNSNSTVTSFFSEPPYGITIGDIQASPPDSLATVTIFSTTDQCSDQLPLQFAFPISQTCSPITFTPTSTPTTCGLPNGTITVTTASGGSGTGYTVSLDGGAQQAIPHTFMEVTSGLHSLTVADSSTPTACTATQPITIDSSTAVTVTLSSTDAQCEAANGSITLTAMGGSGTYTYSNPPGTVTFPVDPNPLTIKELFAGTYTFIVSDTNGCTAGPQTVEIKQSGSTITFTAGACPATCPPGNNGAIELTEVDGGTPPYSWSIANKASQSINQPFTCLKKGTYTVTVQDSVGCFTSQQVDVPLAEKHHRGCSYCCNK